MGAGLLVFYLWFYFTGSGETALPLLRRIVLRRKLFSFLYLADEPYDLKGRRGLTCEFAGISEIPGPPSIQDFPKLGIGGTYKKEPFGRREANQRSMGGNGVRRI